MKKIALLIIPVALVFAAAAFAVSYTGTDGPDWWTGTSGGDSALMLGGNDSAYGNAGNDNIYGGGGYDYEFGESGADHLDAGGFYAAGSDTLKGDEGDDDVFGEGDGSAPDFLYGGSGNDSCYPGQGDWVSGNCEHIR